MDPSVIFLPCPNSLSLYLSFLSQELCYCIPPPPATPATTTTTCFGFDNSLFRMRKRAKGAFIALLPLRDLRSLSHKLLWLHREQLRTPPFYNWPWWKPSNNRALHLPNLIFPILLGFPHFLAVIQYGMYWYNNVLQNFVIYWLICPCIMWVYFILFQPGSDRAG